MVDPTIHTTDDVTEKPWHKRGEITLCGLLVAHVPTVGEPRGTCQNCERVRESRVARGKSDKEWSR